VKSKLKIKKHNIKKRKPPFFYIFIAFAGLHFLFLVGCSTATRPSKSPGYTKSPKGYTTPSTSQKKTKPYKIGKNWYYPMAHAKDFRQRGIASWYGRDFHGKKTSNGEIYNMYAMTAAHKTLPLGTSVSVRNLENKREVEVRVNDRGPFVRGRVIDLSYTAAKKLGIVNAGTAPVEIIALGMAPSTEGTDRGERLYVPVDYSKGNFTVQVGAFRDQKNALRLKQQLSQTYKNAHIATFDNGKEILYRVRVGKCSTLEQAEEYEKILIRQGFRDAMAVAE